MLPGASDVKQYWVNLHESNKGLRVNRKHKDLLEINSVQTLLDNIVTNNSSAPLPEFLQTSRPSDYNNAKPRIRMALYSPLDIHLYDDMGNHTGPKKITVDGIEKLFLKKVFPIATTINLERESMSVSEGANIFVLRWMVMLLDPTH
jgi:hypothetical protein